MRPSYGKDMLWGSVAILSAIGIIGLGFFGPASIQNALSTKASIISAAVTIIYVWLTYGILRQATQGQQLPYVKVDFIIAGKFDEEFIRKYDQKIRKNELYLATISDYQSNQVIFNKNAVFIRVKNVGDRNAVESSVECSYNKKSLGQQHNNMRNEVNFGVLEVNQESIEMIEVFDRSAQADSFEVSKVLVSYKDVGGKLNSGNGVVKRNFTSDVTFEEVAGVEITFGKKTHSA